MIGLGHGCAGWEAQALFKEMFADLSPYCSGRVLLFAVIGSGAAGGKNRLTVHGFPYRSGFDVFCFQSESYGFVVCTKVIRIDQHYGQPAGEFVIRRFQNERRIRNGQNYPYVALPEMGKINDLWS